uniref:Uncharacterized protein n=1 Tax=Anguilla anguilla TaxID=7936 RepID=A0A0E9PKA0_ANGAN
MGGCTMFSPGAFSGTAPVACASFRKREPDLCFFPQTTVTLMFSESDSNRNETCLLSRGKCRTKCSAIGS